LPGLPGESQRTVAKTYGVDRATISRLQQRVMLRRPSAFGTRQTRPLSSRVFAMSKVRRILSSAMGVMYSRSQIGLSAVPRFTSRLVAMRFVVSSSRRVLLTRTSSPVSFKPHETAVQIEEVSARFGRLHRPTRQGSSRRHERDRLVQQLLSDTGSSGVRLLCGPTRRARPRRVRSVWQVALLRHQFHERKLSRSFIMSCNPHGRGGVDPGAQAVRRKSSICELPHTPRPTSMAASYHEAP
jgi:hypothetical protein